MPYTVAVIGTGAHPDAEGEGFSMGYRHAEGFESHPDCELVACADLVEENAAAFARAFDIDEDGAFVDHRELLAAAEPDVVSVATPAASHEAIVADCAGAGVAAVHCEKPLAPTWGACRSMVDTCDRWDVQLTVNHQLRLVDAVVRAHESYRDGAIGNLERIELSRGDLLERGIHQFDLASYFAGDVPGEWVLAGLDYRTENVEYGMHNENQAIVHWRFENGIHGLAATGEHATLIGCSLRLVGTDGTIEIGVERGPGLRIRTGGAWESIDVAEGAPVAPAIHHVVDALAAGETALLDAHNALIGHELVFAAWESVRRRGRVDLPLEVEDNPLAAMVETGALSPREPDDEREL